MIRPALALLLLAAACSDSGNLTRIQGGCPPGTHPSGSLCVADASSGCPTGQHASGGVCVADDMVCGPGTILVGSECVPQAGITCGAGTRQSGTECVPADGLTCGAGTHLSGNACVPDTVITCGPGTHASSGVCLPDPQLTCGSGTHQDGTVCVPDATLTCGAGTHPDGGRCVWDAETTFELRVADATITADGYSKIPVLVIGRNADGTPSQASIVLWTSRPGAGSFSPTQVTLGPLGTIVYFTPCSSANVGCTGTVELLAYLASDLTAPVATSGTLTLVAPEGVGSAAACLLGGNVLFFDGNDYIFNGTQTVRTGTFTASDSERHVRLWITPSDPAQGLWWSLDFSSEQLGQPLAEQVYDGAYRYPFEPPGSPGMDVSGDGRGCNTLSGRFEIQDLVVTGGALSRFTATFEQHCEQGASVLRGCVHLEQ